MILKVIYTITLLILMSLSFTNSFQSPTQIDSPIDSLIKSIKSLHLLIQQKSRESIQLHLLLSNHLINLSNSHSFNLSLPSDSLFNHILLNVSNQYQLINQSINSRIQSKRDIIQSFKSLLLDPIIDYTIISTISTYYTQSNLLLSFYNQYKSNQLHYTRLQQEINHYESHTPTSHSFNTILHSTTYTIHQLHTFLLHTYTSCPPFKYNSLFKSSTCFSGGDLVLEIINILGTHDYVNSTSDDINSTSDDINSTSDDIKSDESDYDGID